MSSEKRRFSRIPLKRPAKIILDSGAIHEVSSLENISVGGCQVPTERDYTPNAPCRVEIQLGSDPDCEFLKIKISGTIIWVEGESSGVQFSKIDPDSLFHLQNLIRYNAPDPEKIDSEVERHRGIL